MNGYGLLSFLVCIGIPAAGAVVFLMRRNGAIVSFVAGALCFLISQPLLRLPILAWLSREAQWYYMLPYVNIVLYYGFMGLTAGIFEEGARWLGFCVLGKKRTSWEDGLAFGLGHGGIEAAWLFVTQVIPAIQGGQAGWNLVLGSWERLFTMLVHIGLTFVVLRGIRSKKIRWLLLAVLLHGAVDFLLILGIFGNVWVVEGLIALEGTAGLVFTLRERKRRI